MPLSRSGPKRYTASKQLIGGDDINAINDQLFTIQSLTASVTQTQASALANAAINAASIKVTTGNANDVVALPKGYPGLKVLVYNASANALSVYPFTGDKIGAGAANALFAHPASKSVLYQVVEVVAGVAQWAPNVSA